MTVLRHGLYRQTDLFFCPGSHDPTLGRIVISLILGVLPRNDEYLRVVTKFKHDTVLISGEDSSLGVSIQTLQ